MANKKINKPSRKIGLSAVLLVLVAVGSILFISQSNKGVPANAYYVCPYHTEQYARCVPVISQGGCYGYYYFKLSSYKNGIKIDKDGEVGGTCEGLPDGNKIYFDKQGNYLE